MPTVPFVDLTRLHAPLAADLRAAALRVLDSGKYIGGPEVAAFEAEMAAHLGGGVAGVVGVACGTSALVAALKAVGVGPGDEVLVPVHTAICTPEAVTLAGARTVFCDIVGDGRYDIDLDDAERRVGPMTRAMIPVHLYGEPADLDGVREFAAKHRLKVVEDCAQAQGARWRGAAVGTYGDVAAFSFFPSKNLGCFGDGGAVAARSAAVLKAARMWSNHGREDKYHHVMEGFNSRLDALQAAMLRVCLPRLEAWNAARRRAAGWYDAHLAGIPGLVRPRRSPHSEPAPHLYVVTVPDREELAQSLKAAGIETGVHYPMSLNLQPAYASLGLGRGAFPRAEWACDHMLSLPMHPGITEEEVAQVSAAVRAHLGGERVAA